jgi:hypothetical protein
VAGGSHFGAVTAVVPFAVEGVDDFEADDEQAASAATNRLVPTRPNLRTLFPPGCVRPNLGGGPPNAPRGGHPLRVICE